MEKIKLTISSKDRLVIIPIEYDKNNDNLQIDEMQVEPIPAKEEQLDTVLMLASIILHALNGNVTTA